MERLWSMDCAALVKQFSTTAQGLTEQVAEQRLSQYGLNKLQEAKRKHLLQVFFEQFRDLLVAILLAAAGISAVTGGTEGAAVIIAVLLLNALLGTLQHSKAQNALDSLQAMTVPLARVRRSGESMEVPAETLVPGDLLLLEAGDIAAADGRIIEQHSFTVDESALTGEAESVEKTADRFADIALPLGDRRNMVYSGSQVRYGRAEVLVTATGMQTEIGKIAHLMASTQEKTTPLQRTLNAFSKKLSIGVLVICGLVFVLGLWREMTVTDALLFAVALAVAAIPEALGSIVTIGLAIGTQKMAKEHAILKELQAVESLGCVSVICSDKTGTLTKNQMTVQEVYVPGEIQDHLCAMQKETAFAKLVECSVLCNDGALSKDGLVGDPTETALLMHCRKLGWDVQKVRDAHPRLAELPFDSDRKLMSTLHKADAGYLLYTKGAPDVLLSRCVLEQSLVVAIEEKIASFSSQGLRVLAFAEKNISEHSTLGQTIASQRRITLQEEHALTFLGLVAMMDPPREETAHAVAECRQAGIRPVMITGDHKMTAAAIARKIDIWRKGDRILEGVELDAMDDAALRDAVTNVSVYARVSPEHKIRIVRAWQERGAIVAMTGDGVNDAPALKQADVGIAMGIAGTNVSKDAASMILTDDNFATILKAVQNGRSVYANIVNAVHFLLSGNLAAILVVLYSSLFGLPLPFTAVQLLFINLVTDSLPALAINMEPPTDRVMLQKPRDPKESILTPAFVKTLALQGSLLAMVTLCGFYAGLRVSAAHACTVAFAVLCLARLFHGFNCRGDASLWRLPGNRYSVGAFFLGALLLLGVLLLPGLHPLFDIANTIDGADLWGIVALAALPTILIQGYRRIGERTK